MASVFSMQFPDERGLSSLYLPSGLTVHSCCGCAWQMSVDSGDETKVETAFDAHRCEHFPILSDLLQPV